MQFTVKRSVRVDKKERRSREMFMAQNGSKIVQPSEVHLAFHSADDF
jgi:hypothetical protein